MLVVGYVIFDNRFTQTKDGLASMSRWARLSFSKELGEDIMEKCSNCGGLIDSVDTSDGGSRWIHPPSHTRASCNNPVPGMGLTETIQLYYTHPQQYAVWARKENQYTPNGVGYTGNAILHGLRMQATIHWNNCSNEQCKNCLAIGQDTANRYMQELANGRHDLHPKDDSEVHILAFDIHNVEAHAGRHGRPGIMTCTYVVGPGSGAACYCYELAYQQWLKQPKPEVKTKAELIIVSPDDMYYEPRYE